MSRAREAACTHMFSTITITITITRADDGQGQTLKGLAVGARARVGGVKDRAKGPCLPGDDTGGRAPARARENK